MFNNEKHIIEISNYRNKISNRIIISWTIQFQSIFWILAIVLFSSYSSVELKSLSSTLDHILNYKNIGIDLGVWIKTLGGVMLIGTYLLIAQASVENLSKKLFSAFGGFYNFELIICPLIYILLYGLLINFLSKNFTKVDLIIICIFLFLLTIVGFIYFYRLFGIKYFFLEIVGYIVFLSSILNKNNDYILSIILILLMLSPFFIILSYLIAYISQNLVAILIKEYHSSYVSKEYIYEKVTNNYLIKDNSISIRPMLEIRNEITKWVIDRNLFNLFNSIILNVIFCISFSLFLKYGSLDLTKKFLIVVYLLFSVRLFSRSSEIVYSFYNDIVSKNNLKNTFLNRGDRIALAVKSLIEIVIVSTGITVISFIFKNLEQIFQINSFEWSKIIPVYLFSFMKSISISLFNFSYTGTISFESLEQLLTSFIHIILVITSVVLITLSLAGYMNTKNERVFFNIEYNSVNFSLIKYLYNQKTIISKIVINDKRDLISLKLELERLWQQNNINDNDFNECIELIEKTDLKKEKTY